MIQKGLKLIVQFRQKLELSFPRVKLCLYIEKKSKKLISRNCKYGRPGFHIHKLCKVSEKSFVLN